MVNLQLKLPYPVIHHHTKWLEKVDSLALIEMHMLSVLSFMWDPVVKLMEFVLKL